MRTLTLSLTGTSPQPPRKPHLAQILTVYLEGLQLGQDVMASCAKSSGPLGLGLADTGSQDMGFGKARHRLEVSRMGSWMAVRG